MWSSSRPSGSPADRPQVVAELREPKISGRAGPPSAMAMLRVPRRYIALSFLLSMVEKSTHSAKAAELYRHLAWVYDLFTDHELAHHRRAVERAEIQEGNWVCNHVSVLDYAPPLRDGTTYTTTPERHAQSLALAHFKSYVQRPIEPEDNYHV